MCLAVPMLLVERNEWDGVAELHGLRRRIGLMLCPDAEEGSWVLVHAGYAIGTVDEDEAATTLSLFEQGRAFEEGA